MSPVERKSSAPMRSVWSMVQDLGELPVLFTPTLALVVMPIGSYLGGPEFRLS